MILSAAYLMAVYGIKARNCAELMDGYVARIRRMQKQIEELAGRSPSSCGGCPPSVPRSWQDLGH